MVSIILGTLTGLILGLTGAGGGILAVPALVIGLGYEMATAAPIALIAVGMAALLGAIDGLRRGLVRYKAAFFMAGCGALSSGPGLRLARTLPESWLATAFGLIMLLVAWRMLRSGRADKGAGRTGGPPCRLNPETGRLRWTVQCTATLAAIGTVTGLFAGMLGVGGGFVIVPTLRRYSDISIHGIVATSLMLVSLVSLSAVLSSLAQGQAIPAQAWGFAGMAMVGMLLGRKMAPKLSGHHLQTGFALLALVVAVLMFVRAWS